MVMIPPAPPHLLPAGLQAMVHNQGSVRQAQKREIGAEAIVGQRLLFTICHQTGCSAENELPPAMLEGMKKSDIVLIRVPHPSGQWLSAVIPLEGFAGRHVRPPDATTRHSVSSGRSWPRSSAPIRSSR